MVKRSEFSLVLLSMGAFSSVACLGSRGPAAGSEPEPSIRDSVLVRVVNQNYYSARIHAVYDGGNRFIIGTVDANSTADDFFIPWQPRALFFEIDLITGPGLYLSDRVLVSTDDIVELTLPPDLEYSGFFRRISR